ncbi:hypothetical protein A5634_09995 [Mycobacterium asiaticum]|uniref:Tox-PL domain-containing protein n=1 Tax=Mycobacterium asiaticum TaxID=1790 RepID=A0A1A3NMJ5_MYCAS|nr:toxin glutamine deamidase domain-containing protein [Mycobacterium asiaticum]OBK21562.1 hypothetical protein A5634_09995 [Mycobacterium asiaticum]
MGIELPGWLRWVGDLIGEPFPEGDETACRRQRDKWRHYADQLEGLKDDLDSATQTTLAGFTSGDIHNKLDELLRPYGSSIDQIAGQLRQLADAVDGVATEIEFAKEMFIANLVALAAAITALVATAWINWTAPAEIAGAVALAEAAITQVIRAAVAKVASEAVARVIAQVVLRALEGAAANALMSGALNAGIQGQQAIQGNRHQFDSTSFWNDVESGAISGAVMGPVLKGAHDFDAGSALGNRAKNFGASFVGNAGGALAAQQALTGHVNLADALGAGAVFGAVDGVRSPGGHIGTDTTALTGDRPGSLTVEPLPAGQHSLTPPVDAAPTFAGRSPESVAAPGGNVDVPLNLGSHGADVVPPAAHTGLADTGITAAPANHPGVVDAPATGSSSGGAPPPSTPQVASAPTGSPGPHGATQPPTPQVPATRAGLSESGPAAAASLAAGTPIARTADAVAMHGGSDVRHLPAGAESTSHPVRDADLRGRDVESPRDAQSGRDGQPAREARLPRDGVVPRDVVAPHDISPSRDAAAGREAQPSRDAQPPRDAQPRRDGVAPRESQAPRDPHAARDGHQLSGRDGHDRSNPAEPFDRSDSRTHQDRSTADSHAGPLTQVETEHTKDTAGQRDSEHHRDISEPHDETLIPSAVISPVFADGAHPAVTSMAAEPSARSGSERAGGQHDPPRRPDPDEPHGGDDPAPIGPGPHDATGFDNPANHRNYGPHELSAVEDPAYQTAVRKSLEDPNGGYTTWADPRSHPYGHLINDGGHTVDGRANNCVDCSLSALASFHGHPTVSAPRFLDRLPDGTLDLSGERSGFPRAKAWLGDGLHSGDRRLSVSEQFEALHKQIEQMGPGASALVVNEWHAMDHHGQPMFDAHGRPVVAGAHATVVVYPRDASGPVWWDPQHNITSDHPPARLADRSASLWYTTIAADHFGPNITSQGGQHGGAGHRGTSAGLPGRDISQHAVSRDAVRDGLGLLTDHVARGDRGGAERGFGEFGDRFADRGRDGAVEPGSANDRGGLRDSEARREARGEPDLSVPVEHHDPTHSGGPGDHRLPDGGSVVERSTGSDSTASPDHSQAHLPLRSEGPLVERGDVLRGMAESGKPGSLAHGGDDAALAAHPALHEPAHTGSVPGDHQLARPEEAAGLHVSASGDDPSHQHPEPADRGRGVASHADPQHAQRIANEALWKRIPPVSPDEIRHHLGDKLFGEQRARDNAAWWRELSGEEQRALVDSYAREVGNAEGIPPWARTQANDHRLSQLHDELQSRKDAGAHLSRPEKRELGRYNEIRRALDEARGRAEKLGAEVHILAFDPHEFRGDGRMVVSVGHDPHRADAVSWHVPGFSTTIESIGGNLTNAMNHFESVRMEHPQARVASIAWIGYDAPQGLRGLWDVAHTRLARAGGDILRGDLAAFSAARDAIALDGNHFSNNDVFGHSYGSTTTSFAGHGGELTTHARSITLAGSPGAGPVRHASEFGLGERVFVASSSRDPVTMLGARSLDGLGTRLPETYGRAFGRGLGLDPAMQGFGAHRLTAEFPRYMDHLLGRTEGTAGTHSAYYRFDSRTEGLRTESLANFGRIGAGMFERVHPEQHRFDVDRSEHGWWRTVEPAESRALENPADLSELRRRFWDPRWHSVFDQHPVSDARCAHVVTNFLVEHSGRDVVLQTEPGPTGVPARDLFQAWGSASHFASYAEIHEALLQHGEGSAAIMVSRWSGGPEQGGHAYVAINEGGAVHLYEQVGDRFEQNGWPPAWGESAVDRTAVGYLDRYGNPVDPLDGDPAQLQAAELVGDVAGGNPNPTLGHGSTRAHDLPFEFGTFPETARPDFTLANPPDHMSAELLRLSEQHLTGSGETVLGPFRPPGGGPSYIEVAESRGASYFSLGDLWDNYPPVQQSAANQHVLDIAIANRDTITLSVPYYEVRPDTWTGAELRYILAHGYERINDSTFVPSPRGGH